MARARNIKPGFFENEVLAEMPIAARLLFIGLWTLADRAGRLEDRPGRIRLKLMPLDDVDVDALLQRLHDDEMILRYTGADGLQYIQVLNFEKHQSPHCKEKASTIPAPDMPGANTRQAEKGECDAPPDSLILRLSDSSSVPNGTDAAASDSEKPPPQTLEEQIWSVGLETVARLAGEPKAKCRSVIGKWRQKAGDREVLDAIMAAEKRAVSDPFSYITKCLSPKHGPSVRDSFASKTYTGTPDEELPEWARA